MLSTIMTALKRIIGNIVKIFSKQTKQFCRLFNENDCWKYFMKTCHEPKSSKIFNIPSWMKQLEERIKDFNTNPPTYNEINKMITGMKSSTSSCRGGYKGERCRRAATLFFRLSKFFFLNN